MPLDLCTGIVITGPNSFGENTWVNASGQINGGLMTEQDAAGIPITVGCSSFFDVFVNTADFDFALTWIPSPAGYPQTRFFQTYAQAFAALPVPIPAGLTPDIRQLCGPITTVVSQTACPNSVVSVPIILSEGWNNLESISLMLLYDQNVLQFQSAVVDPGIPGASATGVNGVFTLGYFGPGALTTPTLATINFKVLSCSNTGITNLTWAYNPTGAVPPDLSSNEYFPTFSPTNPVPYFQDPFGTYFVNGTVNVTDAIAPTITCPGPVTQNTDPNLCTAVVTWLPAYTHSIPAARNNGAYTEDSWFWQAFDVPVSGILTGIQINVRNNYGPFTVKLYKGDGNAGCSLYSASYTPTGTGLQTIPIPRSVGVYLTTGQVYTFEAKGVISGCTPSIDLWCTYSGGGPVYTRNVWDNWVPCGGLGVPSFAFCVNLDFFLDNITGVMTVSDNCDVKYITNTPENGSTFAQGTTLVTATATDFGGNAGTCNFNVTVVDNQIPTITCAVPAASYGTTVGCTYVVPGIALDPTATGDNCGVLSVTNNINGLASLAGAAFPVGTTNVIWTITDVATPANTATCSYNVVVVDNVPPTITCAVPAASYGTNVGCTYVVPGATLDPTATGDNCGVLSVTNNINGLASLAGVVFPVGTTNVIWTITDVATPANTATCSYNVVVVDNVPPTITCAIPAASYGTNVGCTYVVPGIALDPTATGDNCGVLSIINNFNGTNTLAGAIFPVGTTNVVWTITDIATPANTATCNYNVVVVDNVPPTITCAVPAASYGTNVGCTYIVPGIALDPTATGDNCGVLSVTNSFNGLASLAGAAFPVGSTLVVWTITDIATPANTATCSYNVVVVDNVPPTITCAIPAASYGTNVGCTYVVPGIALDPTATGDNCGVLSVTNNINGLASLAGAAFPVGTTNVIWTITDVATPANTATCSYNVVVVDNVPPTITCAIPAASYGTNVGCTYVVPGAILDPTATGDNCGVLSVINNFNGTNTLAGAIFPVGTTNVVWTITDNSYASKHSYLQL